MLRLSPAVCVAALVTACTPFKVDPTLSYACASDEDCAALSQSCVDGRCMAPPDEGQPDGGVDAGCRPKTCEQLGKNCGPVDDGCGRELICGACGAGQGCGAEGTLGVCGACQATDVPDDEFLDADCDGIDGQLDTGIFVDVLSGSDANAGTATAPLKSVQIAVFLAMGSGRPVLVSKGTYKENFGIVSSGMPVSIHGGYDSASEWSRAASNLVTIESLDGTLLADTQQPLVLDYLTLTSLDAIVPSKASVALRVEGIANVELRHVTLRAGAGAAGSMGGTGGPPAVSGDLGGAGTDTTGGDGGTSACMSPGGSGGAGGPSGQKGPEGSGGAGGAAGGMGGPMAGDCLIGTVGSPGGPGEDGAPGKPGEPGGGGAPLGTWLMGDWVAAPGVAGQNGSPGGGGGGGGGGAGQECTAIPTPGGGGGGGGGGGCGGIGGGGGGGGGASVGLHAIESNISYTDVSIQTEGGGAGGKGGIPGPPGAGGMGGEGATPTITGGGKGGKGGFGGNGGTGGEGGGGGGGPSVGVWCTGQVKFTGSFGAALGPGGKGGASTGRPGADGESRGTVDCQ